MGDAADVWTIARAIRKTAHDHRLKLCVEQRNEWPYKLDLRELAPMHWRYTHGAMVVDFWPTSGRYIGIRGTKINGVAKDLHDLIARVDDDAARKR